MMRLRTIIFLAMSGCIGGDEEDKAGDDTGEDTRVSDTADTGCEMGVDEIPFELDWTLDELDIEYVERRYDVDEIGALSCEQICTVWPGHENEELDITACTFEAETARLSCAGMATVYYPCGRRPQGHQEADCEDSLGGFLARCAHLEASSVVAFEELAAQLTRHGAPRGARRALPDRRRGGATARRADGTARGGARRAGAPGPRPPRGR